MGTVVLIALGGAAGANARFVVSMVAARRWGTSFPWGTLLINATGSFLLGLFLALPTLGGGGARALLATGFCGGYTTFSTFAYESVALGGRGARVAAAANLLGSVILCVAAAALGGALGAAVGR